MLFSLSVRRRSRASLLLSSALAALTLLTACEMPTEEDNSDDGARTLVGEFLYADWGPDDRLAVVHVPQDSLGRYRYELGGLYTMQTDGSGKRPLVLDRQIGTDIRTPVWSPDGQWIAFVAAGQILKVSTRADTVLRVAQLTRDALPKSAPAWSPDGQWITYQVASGSNIYRGLWAVRADGSESTPFTKPPAAQMCLQCPGNESTWPAFDPDWSSRGAEIAFVAFEEGVGAKHLAVYDTTSAQVSFVHKADNTIYTPSVSPDGSKIVFFTAPSEGPGDLSIWVINRDGTGLQQLNATGQDPNWSPDGRQILYRQNTVDDTRYQEPGYGELWIMNADGTDKRQITFSYHSRRNGAS